MKEKNPLGEKSQYSDQYDPSLLFAIPRSQSREKLLSTAGDFVGEDRWTAYEVSWLDSNGKPQVRLAEFVFRCDSDNIIESKSFKLYLNSLNQTRFDSERKVKSLLLADLSAVANTPVVVNLLPLHYAKSQLINEPIGLCLDDIEVFIEHYEPNANLLQNVVGSVAANEVLYSHLLKTNCPVTDQPDWATIFIEYAGQAINHESLLKYIVSFRQHQDFHENSVERIFCDINTYCKPDNLTVYARYTRRGGLDINPLRTSYPMGKSLLAANALRLIRQ